MLMHRMNADNQRKEREQGKSEATRERVWLRTRNEKVGKKSINNNIVHLHTHRRRDTLAHTLPRFEEWKLWISARFRQTFRHFFYTVSLASLFYSLLNENNSKTIIICEQANDKKKKRKIENNNTTNRQTKTFPRVPSTQKFKWDHFFTT